MKNVTRKFHAVKIPRPRTGLNVWHTYISASFFPRGPEKSLWNLIPKTNEREKRRRFLLPQPTSEGHTEQRRKTNMRNGRKKKKRKRCSICPGEIASLHKQKNKRVEAAMRKEVVITQSKRAFFLLSPLAIFFSSLLAAEEMRAIVLKARLVNRYSQMHRGRECAQWKRMRQCKFVFFSGACMYSQIFYIFLILTMRVAL